MEQTLIRLAQDLEWLGSEVQYHNQKLPPQSEIFMERQREVLATADKIERELKMSIRYNLARLLDVDYPLAASLHSLTELISAVEDIRHAAVFAVPELRPKVKSFSDSVKDFIDTAIGMPA